MAKSLLFQACTLIALVWMTSVHSEKTKAKPKRDPNDNKGTTPFFLQDPRDEMCLGPYGFTVCDERALWVLTNRSDRKKTYSLVSLLNPSESGMCLERKYSFFGLFGNEKVGMGFCSKSGSKNWDFQFIDKVHIKLSTNGQCLVRGKRKYKNSYSVQSCTKGEALPLVYHPTAVHENGFNLKAADGRCFDGSRFRPCSGSNTAQLLWGVGVKYVGGRANRYFYNFQEQDNCIVAKGSKVEKGSCKSSGAMRWGLTDGKLSFDNGKVCVARLADNTAALSRCTDAHEYITLDVPTTYTEADIAAMLKNQDQLSVEQRQYIQQLAKQQSLNR